MLLPLDAMLVSEEELLCAELSDDNAELAGVVRVMGVGGVSPAAELVDDSSAELSDEELADGVELVADEELDDAEEPVTGAVLVDGVELPLVVSSPLIVGEYKLDFAGVVVVVELVLSSVELGLLKVELAPDSAESTNEPESAAGLETSEPEAPACPLSFQPGALLLSGGGLVKSASQLDFSFFFFFFSFLLFLLSVASAGFCVAAAAGSEGFKSWA